MAFILIIAFILYVYFTEQKIKDLKSENKRLRHRLNDFINGDVTAAKNPENNSAEQVSNKNNFNNVQTVTTQNKYATINVNKQSVQAQKQPVKELTEEEKREQNLKKERQEREKKNTTILITGALLIVLAAIVFLTSTWNTVSNIIKTAVLVLLVGVFFGASKIADERFKLKKASSTFFYLAMAYIPICLISCSIFGLFGNYFSIYGEGRYTYLAMSMLVTAGIYYINYKIKQSKVMFYGSVLSQICSVILFGLLFEENVLITCIMLLIYNIVLILLTKKEDGIELLKYFYNGIPYILGVATGFMMFGASGYIFVIFPLLIVNYLLLYLKKDNTILNAYLFNISLYVFGLFITLIYDYSFEFTAIWKSITGLIYTFVVLVIEGILSRKDESLIKSSMVVSMISVGVMYFRSLLVETALAPWIVAGLESLLMLLVYVKSKEFGKQVLSYLIPSCLVITIGHVLREWESEYPFYIIASLFVFLIGELAQGKKFKQLNKGFLIISNITVVLTFFGTVLTHENEFSNDVIFFILLELMYVYCFLKYKYRIFKYLSYGAGYLILITGCEFLKLPEDLKAIMPLVISIASTILENKNRQLKDNYTPIAMVIIPFVVFLGLNELDDMIGTLIGLIYSGYIVYNSIQENEGFYARLVPYIAPIFLIANTNSNDEIITIFTLIATCAITFLSIYQKKLSIETIFSGIYLLLTLERFDNNFIQQIFVIIWSFVNMYFMKSEKSKDIFKAITYISIFALYNSFLEEFKLNSLSAWNAIGITILAIALVKTIINKYIKSTDNLEYAVYGLIYLMAIAEYVSELDGILFVLFIVGLVIYSYMKKYGALFIVSIFAILLNAILLTREFWLAIPWWIYLLLIGGILIAFAIKNESDDKKEKINVGNVIKNIKDKIEK